MASWCVPCQVEHPELLAFDAAHRDRGDAALIGVTFDNDADDARAFFEERGGDWPVLDDPENSVGVTYGVTQPPETFLITPGGEVAHRITGETTQADLEDVIDAFEGRTG
jgi:peroxiredoxin